MQNLAGGLGSPEERTRNFSILGAFAVATFVVRIVLQAFTRRYGVAAVLSAAMLAGALGSAFGVTPVFWANAAMLATSSYLSRR